MDYSELAFYHKARKVTKRVNADLKKWPNTGQAQTISRQLFRAATSVGANIAEGHGRHEGQEYIHYLYIAQGSANEVDHWLNTTLDCNLGNQEEIRQLIRLNNETRRMLNSTLDTPQQKRKANKSLREPSSPYSPPPYPFTEEENESL